MPELSDIVGFFGSSLMSEQGEEVSGILRDPPVVGNAFDNLVAPRHLLVTPAATVVRPGMVLHDPFGTRFLAGGWANETLFDVRISRSFVLYPCNARVTWTRNTSTTDPVSGLERIGTPQTIGTVWAVREDLRRDRDRLEITREEFRLLIGAALQVGDRIDATRVHRVQHNLGLTYAELL